MSFISHIKEEFQVIQERDPAIKTPLEVLLYPSFRVMIKYRRAHKLYLKSLSVQPERPGLRFIRALRLEKDCSLTMEAV